VRTSEQVAKLEVHRFPKMKRIPTFFCLPRRKEIGQARLRCYHLRHIESARHASSRQPAETRQGAVT
jgi:hypothetical protein